MKANNGKAITFLRSESGGDDSVGSMVKHRFLIPYSRKLAIRLALKHYLQSFFQRAGWYKTFFQPLDTRGLASCAAVRNDDRPARLMSL